MQRKLLIHVLPLSIIVFAFSQCNRDPGEEDLFYEPIINGIYNARVDQSQVLDFIIEPNRAVSVEGQFNDGINFTLEFPAGALQDFESMEAKLSPITEIQNMPSEFEFEFGFSFTPEGIYLTKPGKMTIELPTDLDITDLKGFIFEGADPYMNTNTEIWNVKMTPLIYETINGKKHVVVEIPHFSGFAGITGGEINCGSPRAAETCDELKEILACYLIGKETLNSDDRNKVNGALRTWLEEGISWLEQNPTEIDDEWEVENAISEILCWKATALMFNSNLHAFDELLHRAGKLISTAIVNKLVEADQICSGYTDPSQQRASFEWNYRLMNLVAELESVGMITESVNIDPKNYCNSIGTKLYIDPFMDTAAVSYLSMPYENLKNTYRITFPKKANPAVARSTTLKVYAYNLVGEPAELFIGEGYTLEPWHEPAGYIINGATITEEVLTCHTDYPNGPYPCYMNLYGNAYIRLNLETEALILEIRRVD